MFHLFRKTATEPLAVIGNALDNLFTSDEERLDKQAVLARIIEQPHLGAKRNWQNRSHA